MEKLKTMENRGFTLIEFIIYVAIVGGVLLLTVGFLWNIISANIKEGAYREVQQNGRFVLTKIMQETKKAVSINSPLSGNSANFLSLSMPNVDFNPTIFDIVEGKLRITQGSNPSFYLTVDQVMVSALQFTNLSYEETPGTIRIEMTIEHLNPGNLTEYQASINLKSTVSLLPNEIIP